MSICSIIHNKGLRFCNMAIAFSIFFKLSSQAHVFFQCMCYILVDLIFIQKCLLYFMNIFPLLDNIFTDRTQIGFIEQDR